MARTKVSKLIRVRQGKSTIEFDLDEEDGKLSIQIQPQKDTRPTKVVIGKEAVNVLRDMLGLQQGKLATLLPPDSLTEEEHEKAGHASPDLEGEGDFKEGMA